MPIGILAIPSQRKQRQASAKKCKQKCNEQDKKFPPTNVSAVHVCGPSFGSLNELSCVLNSLQAAQCAYATMLHEIWLGRAKWHPLRRKARLLHRATRARI